MSRPRHAISHNVRHPHKEEPAPYIKSLFETELSHYAKTLEEALPTESEIRYLMEVIVINTDSASWPDDISFNNELRDRVIYTFRDALISWLASPYQHQKTREAFIEKHGEEIAKRTFDDVKKEYSMAYHAPLYWGKKVGYFS